MNRRAEYWRHMECAHTAMSKAYAVDPYLCDEIQRAELIETYKRLAAEAKRNAESEEQA